MNYLSRLNALERELGAQRLNAVLITHLPNIRYLCGFTGSAGALAHANGEWVFFTDGRYTAQARMEVTGAMVRVSALAPLVHAGRWMARKVKHGHRRVTAGVEAENLTVSMQARLADELERAVPRSKLRVAPTTMLVERLRMKKDPDEIQRIREAVQLASSIFPAVLESIRAGIAENDVAARLDYLAHCAGAEKMSFETIVASGARSALPHARPTSERIGRGFVILDYGVILGGYCSDMTRTVHVGRMERAAKDLYAAVLESQMAGIDAVRPGAEAGSVDAAARKVLRKRKLDRLFTHSLGHGLGLEIHEAPRLAKGQLQRLEPGMVITIEPGVYLPGHGGIRIEDTVLVTSNGCEVLTPTSKELIAR